MMSLAGSVASPVAYWRPYRPDLAPGPARGGEAPRCNVAGHPLEGRPGELLYRHPPACYPWRPDLFAVSHPDPGRLAPYAFESKGKGVRWFVPAEVVREAEIRPLTEADEQALFDGFAAGFATRAAVSPRVVVGVVLYHRTSRAGAFAILDEGFRDQWYAAGPGIFVSNVPVDQGTGACSPDGPLFEVVADLGLAELARHERTAFDDATGLNPHPYREWCLPAAWLNAGRVRLLTVEDEAEIEHDRCGQATHAVEIGPAGVSGRVLRPPSARVTSSDWRAILGIDGVYARMMNPGIPAVIG